MNPRRIGLGLAALAGVVLLLFAAAGLAGHLPLVERMLDPASALGPRLYAWKLAWHIFTSAPLLGVGFDAFAFHMVSQLSLIEVGKVWGVDQYAHNLLLQLLAVSGLAGLLALSLPVLGFAKRLWQEKASAERTWAACVLGVLFVHSMLEQPLYHTYFLGIAGVVAGLIDPRAFAFRLPAWPRRLAVLALVLSLGLLVKTAVEYGTLHDNYFSEAGLSPQQNSQFIRSLHAHSLLAPMAELVSPGDIVAADAPVAQKLALSDRVRHFAPTAEHEFRHAALLAEAGQVPMAKQQYLRAARAYPIEMTQYQQRFQALAASDPATFGELAAFANSIGR